MKRIVSLLLTTVLLTAMLSVFVLPASAAGEVSKSENAKWFEDRGSEHVWWELTDNGTVLPDGKTGRTLTIGGKGEMPGFNAVIAALDNRPWKGYIETITTAIIDSGVTNIGNHAFNGCTNLTSVTIPSSVASIGDSAFMYCKSLQSVTIPYGVTQIGDFAFNGCTNLTSVTIPYGVKTIGSNVFSNCTSLQSVTIPASVKSIGQGTFQGCASLQSVTIPSSVTRIDGNAFSGCKQLASVTVKASTPPAFKTGSFYNTPGKLVIYVPCGSGTAYQQASGWSDKSGQIKEAYIVDDQPVGKGKIMFDKDCFPTSNFAEGQIVTISVVPAEGYQLQADSLTVSYKDGEEEKTVELTQDETDPTKYSFEMPKANVTLKGAFEAIPDGTGSILSGGNLWIILGVVAAVLVAVIAALVVVKKKGNE